MWMRLRLGTALVRCSAVCNSRKPAFLQPLKHSCATHCLLPPACNLQTACQLAPAVCRSCGQPPCRGRHRLECGRPLARPRCAAAPYRTYLRGFCEGSAAAPAGNGGSSSSMQVIPSCCKLDSPARSWNRKHLTAVLLTAAHAIACHLARAVSNLPRGGATFMSKGAARETCHAVPCFAVLCCVEELG